jgi:hypothetical protein
MMTAGALARVSWPILTNVRIGGGFSQQSPWRGLSHDPEQGRTRYDSQCHRFFRLVQNTRITLALLDVGTLREVGALRASCWLLNNHGLSVVISTTAFDAWSQFLPRSGGPLVPTGNDRRFLSGTRHLNLDRQYETRNSPTGTK